MSSRFSYLLLLVSLAFANGASAQQSTGSIKGTLISSRGSSRVTVELTELTSRVAVLTASTDTASRFAFYDVPFGEYRALARQGIDTLAISNVTVGSVVATSLTLRETSALASGSGLAYPARAHTLFPRSIIERMPAPGEARKIESILLNTPGIVPAEDGRYLLRGESVQTRYVIDGIPISSNLTRAFSTILNANLIKSADVLRGGIGAEFGDAAAGTLAVTSQSGIGRSFTGRGYQTLGSFNLSEQGAVLGGGASENIGYFAAYGRYSSSRYLDPTSGFASNHANGNLSTIFAKLDILLGENIDLVLLGSYNDGSFGTPNTLIESDSAQDQTTELGDYTFGLRLNWDLSESSTLGAIGYTRSNTAKLRSSGLNELKDSASIADAIRESERFFVTSERDHTVHGGLLEYSIRTDWGGNQHDIKIGAGGETFPLKEGLNFAVTDPATSSSDSIGGDSRFRPYDLTQGGSPLRIDQTKTGNSISAFIQDKVILSDQWSVGLGVRYDAFDLFEKESNISPRVQLAFQANESLTLRGSFDRLAQRPPMENLVISSSAEAQTLSGALQGTIPSNVRSEKANAVELGALISASSFVDLDVSVYGKVIEDHLIATRLAPGLSLPLNLKEVTVLGAEIQARLHPWNYIRGQLTLSASSSKVTMPSDGSSPISGGLLLGHEAWFYNRANSSESSIASLQDQLLAASWLFNYDDGGGYYFTFGGRFDSGLPFYLTDASGGILPGSDTKAELTRRGYSDDDLRYLDLSSMESPSGRVKARFTLDLGVGLDLKRFLGLPIKVQGSVLNVLDSRHLNRFTPVFGGSHYGQPRMFMITIEASS